MNKRMSITVAIIISLFIAVNIHLLYSPKSDVPQSLYVHQYERMTSNHFEEQLQKEALVSPEDIYNVYVGEDDTIDTWLAQEGDRVQVGDEIATLQTGRADSQLAAWEAEREALFAQQIDIESTIYNLEADRRNAKSNTANVNTTESPSDNIDLTVDVQVDVQQDGAFAQAIAEAERERAEIDRKLTVLETQLSQNDSNPALISPVNGTVSAIDKHGFTLAADIFSDTKVLTTYVQLKEWQKIETGDPVRIQQDGLTTVIDGTVYFVSEIPATDSRWKEAFKQLEPKTTEGNPLEFYEIGIKPIEELTALPFGANVNATIIVNEADAVSVKLHWLDGYTKQQATAWKLDKDGKGMRTEVAIPFEVSNRAVVTEGLVKDDVAIYNRNIDSFDTPFNVFLPFPVEMPTKNQWRTFGWKNYLKYSFVE
ncbi:efflux RND transporter periplasmic adaptor subunit [Sporosarcina sp. Sa2YVA2]|uniref:Efflux RND transporter periplasmic adaptor subunit n=1 Tax=Sporosarcina quadrami TaxID=2762234 RepID=A0ABR8U995_9BACL|nr:efflux RND transporter periplasmic adaptor subunit [Sporosarcina quadrami]MBD7984608.1 efflux RND transporter periplasmic adaptor subunit [Sporosarcina quadrami]